MPEQPEQKQETVGEVVAAMRRYAGLVAAANAGISPELAQLLREYADRVERAYLYQDTIYAGRNGEMTLDECIARCEINSGDNPRGRDIAQIGGWLRELRERRNTPGNAAAMREALESCLDFIIRIDRAFNPFMQSLLENAVAKAKAALAAPARNCDKYGIDDIKEMDADFGAFCQQYGAKDGKNCVGCPIKHMDSLCCHSAWMLLTAEGGAK